MNIVPCAVFFFIYSSDLLYVKSLKKEIKKKNEKKTSSNHRYRTDCWLPEAKGGGLKKWVMGVKNRVKLKTWILQRLSR